MMTESLLVGGVLCFLLGVIFNMILWDCHETTDLKVRIQNCLLQQEIEDLNKELEEYKKTEKRFYVDDSGYVVIDNNSEKAFMFDTIEDCYACCDSLNEQHEEIKDLNKKLKDCKKKS